MNYPAAAELGRILLINVGADSRQRFKNRHPEMAPTKNVETGLSPALSSLRLKEFYSQPKGFAVSVPRAESKGAAERFCGYIATQFVEKDSRSK